MSAKIAVSSSITWLIGWMRPRATGLSRSGSVTSTVSAARRASSAASFSAARRSASAACDAVAQAVDERALLLALVRRHGAERLQQRGDGALLAERGDAHGFERGFVGGGRTAGSRDVSRVARSDMSQPFSRPGRRPGTDGGFCHARRGLSSEGCSGVARALPPPLNGRSAPRLGHCGYPACQD